MASIIPNKPIASFVVLTCNRKVMVLALLKELFKQKRIENVEIIVVDNASEDKTNEAIAYLYPNVKLIRLKRNVGCAGRNEGIKKARGEVVITLDDDVFLHRKDEAERIISCFNNHPEVSAINFKILFPHNKEIIPFNWFHPRDYNEFGNKTFETDYISEGAVAFRKKIFENVGYYPEEFFISHEGPDLAYRIIGSGNKIIYSGGIEVLHKCSLQQRSSWRNTYYDTRNYFWLLYRHFPISVFVGQSVFRAITMFVFAIRRNQVKWYLRAIKDSFSGIHRQLPHRAVLSKSSLKRIRDIRSQQVSYFKKLKFFFKKISEQNKQY